MKELGTCICLCVRCLLPTFILNIKAEYVVALSHKSSEDLFFPADVLCVSITLEDISFADIQFLDT